MSALDYLGVFLLSLTPSVEGRYALAVALAQGLDPAAAFAAASLAVVLLSAVLPVALPALDLAAARVAARQDVLGTAAGKYITFLESARRRARPYVDKWGVLGLALFVAVPLPGTGVWSGAAAAYVLGLARAKAFVALSVGGVASNLIVLLSYEAGARVLTSWAP